MTDTEKPRRVTFYARRGMLQRHERGKDMKEHKGTERAFYWSSRAWYAGSIPRGAESAEIMFGMYDTGQGGCTGEMGMRWHDLGSGKVAPRLESFDDSWSALALFSDLLSDMAENDGENITQEGFVEMLKRHGFKDMTSYESPYLVKKCSKCGQVIK